MLTMPNLKPLTSQANHHQNEIVEGCLETLHQGLTFLQTITDQQYCYVATPYVTSSIGEHFRHWLDLFHAIYSAQGIVDYNQRRRGHLVETSRQAASHEIHHFIEWLTPKTANELSQPITIITEVSLSCTKICSMSSTLEREITFAALHANHHFAMVKVATSLLELDTEQSFGLAPTTATYIREQ